MTALNPNPCFNEVCYNWTALYLVYLAGQRFASFFINLLKASKGYLMGMPHLELTKIPLSLNQCYVNLSVQ